MADSYERCKERFIYLRSFAQTQGVLVWSVHNLPKEAFLEMFQIMFISTTVTIQYKYLQVQ
jgi:hypothetical protein